MGNSYRAGFIVFVCSIMGLLMAVIEQMAYQNGFLVDQFLLTASMVTGLEILTIVVAMLVGCVIAAATS